MDRPPIEGDRSRCHRHPAARSLGKRGLAAAGVADQADDRAGIDVQAGARHRRHECAVAALVHHLDVAQLEQAQRATLAIKGSTGHAISRPSSIGINGGMAIWHDGLEYRHRGWKAHPEGLDSGLAGSPAIGIRTRSGASGCGSASMSPRVYGCRACPITWDVGPDSATRPAYMTVIESASADRTPRSCVIRMTASSSPYIAGAAVAGFRPELSRRV